ncbi:profilin-like [Salvia hispanica]|uniref:profilin-like n=1 Tax=Salvia hispanica TaxID=49212 RepID=UPI0020099138|nr:profilin-like [Salvia hispanica]
MWQRYVDEFLMIESDGRKMTSAAILNHDGVVWAKSANFPEFKVKEIVKIVEAFDSPRKLVRKGLRIGGTKYEITQVEQEHVINGKKGTGGIVVKKTSMTLLVGIYNEPMTGTLCNEIVKRTAPYVIAQQYYS